jgi:hypothetical protein
MDTFLDAFALPKLNHLNRSTIQNDVEAIIKSVPREKSLGLGGFTAEYY